MKLYLIAGEASGDARGAEVMQSLTALAREHGGSVEFYGAGGPRMRALAPAVQDWSGEAVVGLWDVLKKYRYFKRQFDAMLAEIDALRPDAVVFIDYPGFNLRMAKALRRRRDRARGEIPRLLYYISPQVWAWNRRRIPQMARTLDLMLCIFPFEQALYEKSGLPAVFVGHPLLDTLAAKRDSAAFPREPALVGLFPGSRSREVAKIFPVMIAAAVRMRRERPDLRFEAAAASESLAEAMRALVAGAGAGVELTIRVGLSHELMQRATFGMVASGTATVEAAFFEMPFVLLYKVAPLTWEVGKRLVRVPFLGMVNILAGRAIVPEFLQSGAEPGAVAREALAFLADPARRAGQQAELRKVIAGLGEGGASRRAAEAIWERLPR